MTMLLAKVCILFSNSITLNDTYDFFLSKAFKKPCIIPPKMILPTLQIDHRVDVAALSSQTTVGHTMDTRGVAHPEFLETVQRWTNTIEHICDAHKQQLWYKLFGDKPVCDIFSNKVI